MIILTKPLGTGVIATAIKADMTDDAEQTNEAIRSMMTLNDIPVRLDPRLLSEINAGTDVTGFGLIGHTLDMVSADSLDVCLSLSKLPLLPGVVELAAMGLLPEGTYNNRIAYQDRVHDDTSCPETHVDIAFDAQTSGGLLLAVNSAKAETVADAIRELGFPNAAIIGRVEEGKGTIHLVD